MMRQGFWNLVAESFYSAWGAIFTVGAVIVAVLLWLFPPTTVDRLSTALPVGLLLVFVALILGRAALLALQTSRQNLPGVIVVRDGPNPILLLEPSELFSHETVVSIYHVDDDKFERLIGLGTVINVQQDGKIQVVMHHPTEGYEDIVNRMERNDAAVIRRILVKPTVPARYFERYAE